MAIDVKCPDCGCELEAPDDATGKAVKCPDCGTRMTVPPPAKSAVKATPAQRPVKRETQVKGKEGRDDRPRRARKEEDEDEDDRPRRKRRRDEDDEDDEDAVSGLIPYKNGRALAAYYCGVFGLIPGVGAVLGPTALILGILGLRYASEHPRAKGSGHAWAGIILGVLGPLGTVAVIVLIKQEILAWPF